MTRTRNQTRGRLLNPPKSSRHALESGRGKSPRRPLCRFERLEPRLALDAEPFSIAFDFGPAGSIVANEFTEVVPLDTYNAARGFGWQRGGILARDRGAGTDFDRDFHFTTDGTFAVDLPNGSYQVTLWLGDRGAYAHDYMEVRLEDTLVDTVSTAAGEVVERSHKVEVSDGQLTMWIRDGGGRDRNAVLDAIKIAALAPPLPQLTISNASVVEGDAGQQQLVFPVTLSDVSDQEVSFSYETTDGTATGGEDFTSISHTANIPPGELRTEIIIEVVGDTTIEPDETLTLSLFNVQGATLTTPSAQGAIISDDRPESLGLVINPLSFSESAGAQAAMITVTRTGPTSESLIVTLVSSDTTEATIPTTLEIPAGDSQAHVWIEAVDDDVNDGDQAVFITATADDMLSANDTIQVTDDDQPAFEAYFDFGPATSPVENGFVGVARSHTYNSADGYGWIAGSLNEYDRRVGSNLERDFVFSPDFTFAVDVPNGRYQVDMILGDLGSYAHDLVGVFLEGELKDQVSTAARSVVHLSYEAEVADEQLTAQWRDLGGRDRNAVVESLSIIALGPIVPEIQVAHTSVLEGDRGDTLLRFEVLLSSSTTEQVSVKYTTTADSATSDSDYETSAGTIIFAPGQSVTYVDIPVHGDYEIETDESLTLTLTDPVGGIIARGQATGTIINDDEPPRLALSVAHSQLSEPGVDTSQLTISRTGDPSAPVTINIASDDESEILSPGEIMFSADQSTVTIPLAAQDDVDTDGIQQVLLTATADDYESATVALSVLDDETPPYVGLFDFGTSVSPVEDGYIQVSDTTVYSESSGFGWIGGAPRSVDRGTPSLLIRDLVYGREVIFGADVPDGEYDIDILFGDMAGYTHDLTGVFIEGEQLDTVTTAGGQAIARSYTVVVGDGQLTVKLQDLGGRDANITVMAMRVLPSDYVIPADQLPWWPVLDGVEQTLVTGTYTNGDGFIVHNLSSAFQRGGTTARVLLPTDYDDSREYPVIYVLPVEAGLRRQFGDGLVTIRNSQLHDQYDAIFVAPSFTDIPWYADNSSNMAIWQETYFKDAVVPTIEAIYPVIPGPAGRLLLGFSKSGYGAVSMILRHPDFFGNAVAWDSPIGMTDPGSGYGFVGVLGSRANFENYRITSLVQQQVDHFLDDPPRIFLQGYSYDFTRADHITIHNLMTELDFPHTYELGVYRKHIWASGWMPAAVDVLMENADWLDEL